MNADEDKYLDNILNLEAKLKTNENVVIKMSQYVQALFMLGPKPLSFYNPKLKHGLGYENPYTLKKEIAHNLKLYDASCLHSSKVHVNVCDSEEILEDVTNRFKDATSVRRPSSRGSSSNNSVLLNIKSYSEDVEVHVRTNKKTNVASKKNVIQNKKIVTNADVKNALKANDIFYVSCD
ncbi:hypothetical protein Tco_0492996 [Tanacetum coccineum]